MGKLGGEGAPVSLEDEKMDREFDAVTDRYDTLLENGVDHQAAATLCLAMSIEGAAEALREGLGTDRTGPSFLEGIAMSLGGAGLKTSVSDSVYALASSVDRLTDER